jgi:hypothetical protein
VVAEDHLKVEALEGQSSYLEVGEAYQEALGVAYLALVDLIDSLEAGPYPAWEVEDAFHLEEVPFPMVEVGLPFPWEVGVV